MPDTTPILVAKRVSKPKDGVTSQNSTLADGTILQGVGCGAVGDAVGEVCFNTAMTGYQEVMTDPSYAAQIVTFTFPHIGNVGANGEDVESKVEGAVGCVVREDVTEPSNFRSIERFADWMVRNGKIGLSGIDTRALTRHLRSRGSMRAGIFSGEAAKAPLEDLVAQVNGAAKMKGLSLSDVVTTADSYTVAAEGEKIGRVAILEVGTGGRGYPLAANEVLEGGGHS